MTTTVLANLIDPEVMADLIEAQLPKAIKFSAIAPLDTTLVGVPGSTLTVPSYKYIGDADEVAEGAAIEYSKLEQTKRTMTIKKAAKGVEITDEAVLSGLGDPVGEGQRQVRMAIASKIDNDILSTALKAPLKLTADIDLDLIDKLEATFTDAPDAIEDNNISTTGVLFDLIRMLLSCVSWLAKTGHDQHNLVMTSWLRVCLVNCWVGKLFAQ